jgi:GDPmannose 4,6-dehydratase
MGSLSARRDWGYAPDYVDAIYRMMQLDRGEEFVIATGKSHSVGDFIETVFREMEIEDKIESNVVSDDSFLRKVEIPSSVGNSNKARKMLAWTPAHDFNMMVRKIVEIRKNENIGDI